MMSTERDWEDEGRLYEDTTPEEAMEMSRTGTAEGFDPLRYGEKWAAEGKDPGNPLFRINKRGVQRLVLSDAQKEWIKEVEHDVVRWRARTALVKKRNFTPWREVSEQNRDYLLSLLWIPKDPLTPMEIIARMSDS